MLRLLATLALLLLAGPALAQSRPMNLNTLNQSATITAGNTFQTVLAAVANRSTRQSLTIQNNNAADNCWIVVGGALVSATKGIAILLLPGGSYTRYEPYIPSDAIHATCASTNDTIYVDTQ